MKKYIENLRTAAEENPLLAIAAVAVLFTATAKLLDANTARSSARIHAMEINRRIAMSAR